MTIELTDPIRRVLSSQGIDCRVMKVTDGPLSTRYTIDVHPSVKLRQLDTAARDVSFRLDTPPVTFKPVEGMVVLTIPKSSRPIVRPSDITRRSPQWNEVPLMVGIDEDDRPIVLDGETLPHLLVAGTTGSGKTTGLRGMLFSLLASRCQIKLIDPKGIDFNDLTRLGEVDHVVELDEIEDLLSKCEGEMEARYTIMRRERLSHYSEKFHPWVIMIDEYADLRSQLPGVEPIILRLVQKARAAGMYVIIATQKPTTQVLNSVIKANCPARLCYQVTSASDSRVVLDRDGAEDLIGRGDFLLSTNGVIIRGQGVKV